MKDFTATNIDINARLHPLKTEITKAQAAAGQSLREVLGTPRASVVITHNGRRVSTEELDGVILAEGDIVNVSVTAEGGGDDSNKVLRSVLQIAVVAAAIVAAGATFGLSTIPGALVAAGVQIGGNLLINAIVPPPSFQLSESGIASGDAFRRPGALTGSRNQLVPYGVVPRVYGKHKIFPPLSARPFTEVQSNVQFLRMLFCAGYGPLRLSNPKIGDTVIGSFDENNVFTSNNNFSEVEIEVAEKPDLYSNAVGQEPVGAALNENGDTEIRTSAADVDEIGLDLLFPQGLFIIDGLETISNFVEFKIQFRETGTSTWLDLPEDARTDRGSNNRASSEVWRVLSSRRETFRSGITFKVPETGQYDIRIERVNDRMASQGWDDEDFAAFDAATWSSIKSIKYEAPVNMPGVVNIGMRVKSTDQLNGLLDNFSVEVEPRIAIYESGAWNEPVFDPETGNGTGGAYTSNPAWVYADVLTGVANDRAIAKSRLNTDDLTAWAAFCAANEFEYNSPGDAITTVFELARAVASVGRASWAIQDGKFSVVIDREQTTPAQMFTPRNSWDFNGARNFPDVPHALRVRFIDPENDWQENERLVFDDGYTEATATKFEVLNLPGVTSAGQAWRMGRYYLATIRLRPETYTLSADVEHIACLRGDMVRVAHDLPLWGVAQGRIKSIETDGGGNVVGITVDEQCFMESGTDYVISVRTGNTFATTATVVNDPGPQTVLALSDPIPAADGVSKGDLFAFGVITKEAVDLKVVRIEPRENLEAQLTLVDAAPAIYSADTGTIPPFDSQITPPPGSGLPRPDPPTITNLRSDETTLVRNTAGQFDIKIVVSFEAAQGVPGETIQGRLRRADTLDGWSRSVSVQASTEVLELPSVEIGKEYIAAIRSVNGNKASDWVESAPHIAGEGITLPGNPGNAVGLITESLDGIYTQIPVDLFVRLRAGIDYRIINEALPDDKDIYITPIVNMGPGLVNLQIEEQVIKAPVGSYIARVPGQEEAEDGSLSENLDELNNVRLPALDLALEELNEVVLPALEANVGVLGENLYFLDEVLGNPEGRGHFIQTLIAESIFVDTLVANQVFTNALVANEIFTDALAANTVFANAIVANEAFIDSLTSNEGFFDKLVANEAFIGEIFAKDVTVEGVLTLGVDGGGNATGILRTPNDEAVFDKDGLVFNTAISWPFDPSDIVWRGASTGLEARIGGDDASNPGLNYKAHRHIFMDREERQYMLINWNAPGEYKHLWFIGLDRFSITPDLLPKSQAATIGSGDVWLEEDGDSFIMKIRP